MKSFLAGLLAHYAQRQTALASFLELRRRDGVYVRFTGASRDVPVDGNVFTAATGLTLSDFDSSASLAVDKLEVTVFPDDAALEADMVAGLWNFASFRLFEAPYDDPSLGVNLLRRGWTGELSSARGGYVLELRSLKQALQQAHGSVTQMDCRYRLGSTAKPDGLCRVDLVPWTHTLTVTAAADRVEFECAAALQADDYFGDGTVTFQDGENAGIAVKVKAFAAGAFTLSRSAPFDIGVGDTLVAVAGCRHRLAEDCRDKFDNVLNFGGEPHMPGMDLITADPEVGG